MFLSYNLADNGIERGIVKYGSGFLLSDGGVLR